MLESPTSQDLPTLSYRFAKRHGVVIAALEADKLIIHHKPELNLNTVLELQRFLDFELEFREISPEAFQKCLAKAYESSSAAAKDMAEGIEEDLDLATLMQTMPQAQDLLESQDDAPVIRLLNALFTQAIKQNASDIHIETFEQHVSVRFRIDGLLQDVLRVPRVLAPLLISRVKVMAKLDIAEKRIPQDGRISLRIAGHNVDVRVSTLPASHGERVVMRILDQQAARLDLSALGMDDDKLATMRALIQKPHGIILVTGPTGSGKTTSLYASLSHLNETSRNILTVEDPIEYDLTGIGQTQVNSKVKMSFARGLRAILRQDPDVVMVGEIRDLETAEIAVQASLTGHLVLSTLHTNTAIGAVARLRDMGVEPFLLSSSLIGLVAQRLVRVLCEHCKKARAMTKAEKQQFQLAKKENIEVYAAVGCEHCQQSGYHGRCGIYELILVDEKLRQMIHAKASEHDLAAYAHQTRMGIREAGFEKIKQGVTSIAEVARVTTDTKT